MVRGAGARYRRQSGTGGVLAAALAALAAVAVGCSAASSSAPSGPARPATSSGAAPSASPLGSGVVFTLPVSHPTVWLCRPGMAKNPCEGGLDATVVRADGSRQREAFAPAKDPKVDCFYVYPTLSPAQTVNAPLTPSPEAIATTRSQAARFASACRLFVPVYRQITVAGLFSGRITPQARKLAADDVSSAWHDYLDHDNNGRGVVLIGHSQGAFALDALMRQEVDPSAQQRRQLVSALLMGGNVLVPPGKDVGGDFTQIPACRTPTQHGCVVAYSMFNTQPPNPSLFGRGDSPTNGALGNPATGLQVLCTNPAALAGGRTTLHPYLPAPRGAPTAPSQQAETPLTGTGFVAPLDLVHAQCRNAGGASWLQVDSDGKAGPLRQKFVAALGPVWGLHVYDINGAEGDLVALVKQQVAAWPERPSG